MSKNRWILASAVAAVGAALAVPLSASAQLIDIFTEDLSAFNANTDLGDGVTVGVVLIDTNSPFGTGVYARYFDFSTGNKPETQGELPTEITGPFQVSFQSVNQSVFTSGNPAIRWRMANSGKSISSQNRSAFSLSWHSDLELSASYVTSSNTISSVSSPPLSPDVHDIMVIGNGSTNETYSYTFAGESRTLDPLSYDVFVDNVLLNDEAEFAGGLGFSVGAATDYDPALGIRRFGLIGSSDSDVDPDVLYDNIFLNIGDLVTGATITQAADSVAAGFSFTSTEGTVYVLQSTTNATAAVPLWLNTGVELTGDGGDQVLFDPSGFDSNKTYRIIEMP